MSRSNRFDWFRNDEDKRRTRKRKRKSNERAKLQMESLEARQMMTITTGFTGDYILARWQKPADVDMEVRTFVSREDSSVSIAEITGSPIDANFHYDTDNVAVAIVDAFRDSRVVAVTPDTVPRAFEFTTTATATSLVTFDLDYSGDHGDAGARLETIAGSIRQNQASPNTSGPFNVVENGRSHVVSEGQKFGFRLSEKSTSDNPLSGKLTVTNFSVSEFQLTNGALVVDSSGDLDDNNFSAGNLTLREAVRIANVKPGDDIISFDSSVFTGGDANVIRLETELVLTGAGLEIDGSSVGGVVLTADRNDDDVTFPGTHITDVANNTNTADNQRRVLNVNGGNVHLKGLTVTGGSTVFDAGAGISIRQGRNLRLTQSTVAGNVANNTFGGGIANFGTLTVENSTVSSNRSSADGGGIANRGSVTLKHATIANNRSSSGGGIHSASGSSTELRNSILAANVPSDIFSNGTVIGSSNLIQDGTGALNNSITGEAKLDPLHDNGGPSATHALLGGSPAIDAVTQRLPGFDTDQRGVPREVIGREQGGVDLGAFAMQAPQAEIAASVNSIKEGEIAKFEVKLSHPVDLSPGIVVGYNVVNGRTLHNIQTSQFDLSTTDTLTPSNAVFIPQGADSATISVAALPDAVFEGDTEIRVTLTPDAKVFTTPGLAYDVGYEVTSQNSSSVTLLDSTSYLPGLVVRNVYGETFVGNSTGGTGTIYLDELGKAKAWITLASQPTTDVNLGAFDATELLSSITFTPANWHEPQLLSVAFPASSSHNDGVATTVGSVLLNSPVAVGNDQNYSGLSLNLAVHDEPENVKLLLAEGGQHQTIPAKVSIKKRSDAIEGAADPGVFEVLLDSPAPAGGLRVYFDVSRSAAYQYRLVDEQMDETGTRYLDIPAGETSGTIVINAVDDFVDDADINVTVTLRDAPSAAIYGVSSLQNVDELFQFNVVSVSPKQGNTGAPTSEVTIDLSLKTQPASDVSLTIADQLHPSSTQSLRFTTQDFAAAKRITIDLQEGVDSRLGFAISSGHIVQSGRILKSEQISIPSRNGEYELVQQTDGNLVLYKQGGIPQWATNTGGLGVNDVIMQRDGNLVQRDAQREINWQSNTSGNPGAYLAVEDNGVVAIHSTNGSVLWASIPGSAVASKLNQGYSRLNFRASLSTTNANYTIANASAQLMVRNNDTAGLELARLSNAAALNTPNQADDLFQFSVTSLERKQIGSKSVSQAVLEISLTDRPGSAVSTTISDQYNPDEKHALTFTPGNYAVPQSITINLTEGSDLGLGLLVQNQSSNTLTPGETRISGSEQPIFSPSGEYAFFQQADGNLVLYRSGVAVWNTNTHGQNVQQVIMQGDGNLVQYDAAGNALWNSNTAGNPGAYLAVEDTGKVMIYAATGEPLWQSANAATNQTAANINKSHDRFYFGIPFRRVAAPFDAATQISIAEGGEEFVFGVRLTSQPTQNVNVNTLPAESTVSTSSGSASRTFTVDDWDSYQPIVLTAVDGANPTTRIEVNAPGYAQTSFQLDHNNNDDKETNDSTRSNLSSVVALLSPTTAKAGEGVGDAQFRITLIGNVPATGLDVQFAVYRRTADFSDINIAESNLTGVDSEVRFGVAQFGPGELEKVVTIPILDDNIDEPVEHFEVTLFGDGAEKPAFRTVANLKVTSGFDGNAISLRLDDEVLDNDSTFVLPAGTELDFRRTDGGIATVKVMTETTLSSSPKNIRVSITQGAAADILAGDISTSEFKLVSSTGTAEALGRVVLNLEDNDHAGVEVTWPENSVLKESDTNSSQQIKVKLRTKPRADVKVIFATDGTEASLNGSSNHTLTFTPDNWNVEQTITLKSVDDDIDDGDTSFQVKTTIISDDDEFNGDIIKVRLEETLNLLQWEQHTVRVSIESDRFDSVVVPEGQLFHFFGGSNGEGIVGQAIGTEAERTIDRNGDSTITLRRAPEAQIPAGKKGAYGIWAAIRNFQRSTDDPLRGTVELSFNDQFYFVEGTLSAGLRFEPSEPGKAAIVLTQDANVGGNTRNIQVKLVDGQGVPESWDTTLYPTMVTTSGFSRDTSLTANERGIPGRVDLQLESAFPFRNLTVHPRTRQRSFFRFEDRTRLNVRQTIVLTPDTPTKNVEVEQIVTSVRSSSTSSFRESLVTEQTFSNEDNDKAGVTLVRTNHSAALTEGVSNNFFSVKLDAEPTASVNVNLEPLNVNTDPLVDGTPSDDVKLNGEIAGETHTLRFDPSNWDVPQLVEVTAVDDALVEFNEKTRIKATAISADADFNLESTDVVEVFITDDDLPTASIRTVANAVEANAPGYFVVSLDEKVPASVGESGIEVFYTIGGTATVNNPDAETDDFQPIFGSVRNAPGQSESPVIAFPIDDRASEGASRGDTPEFLTVTLNAAADGSRYRVGAANTATLTVDDDDKPGVRIFPSGRAAVEGGEKGEFLVGLSSQPAHPVTISFSNAQQRTIGLKVDKSYDSSATTIKLQIDTPNVDSLLLPAGDYHFGSTIATVSSSILIYSEKPTAVPVQLTGNIAQTEGASYSYDELSFSDPLEFTSSNWYQLQSTKLEATDDNVVEKKHSADVRVSVASTDTVYNNFPVPDQSIQIYDRSFDARNTTASLTQGFLSMQDSIDNLELPILGKFGDVAPPIFETFIEDVAAEIRGADNVTADTLRTSFNTAIGNAIGEDSLVMFEVTSLSHDDIGFQLSFKDTLVHSVPLEGNLGLEALDISLESEGTFDLSVRYDLSMGFGISKATGGFYLDTEATSFTVDAGMNLSDNFAAKGSMGFLQVDVINGDTDGTGINAHVVVAFQDPTANADSKLTLTELVEARKKPLDMLSFDITGNATLDLDVTTSVSGDAAFPSFSFNLGSNMEMFNYGNEQEAEKKSFDLHFKNIQLDLGEFVRDLVTPVVTTIDHAVEPIRPVIEVLDSSVDLLEKVKLAGLFDQDGDGKASLLEVATKLSGGGSNTAQNFRKFADAVTGVVDLSDSLADFATSLQNGETIVVDFGDYTLHNLKGGSAKAAAKTTPVSGTVNAGANASPADQAQQSSNRKLANVFGKLNKLGIELPIVTSPLTAIKVFLGQDVDLITWDVPELDLGFSMKHKFPVYLGLKGVIEGDFSVKSDLNFGFDTNGLTQWKENNFELDDAWRVFDGFYLSDVDPDTGEDVDELTLEATLAAGLSGDLGIASATAKGGITGSAGLDLVDIGEYSGESDGKIRGSEIVSRISKPLELFDLSGQVEAFINISASVIFIGEVYNKDLARVTLFEFELGGGSNTSPPNTEVDPATEIGVNSVAIDSGTGQRSMARNMRLEFNSVVEFADGAITVVDADGDLVPIEMSTANQAGRTIVDIDFVGNNLENDSLPNGDYQLRVSKDLVFRDDFVELRTDYVQNFHRLFGDQNGDGVLDRTDTDFFETVEAIKDNPRTSPLIYAGFDHDNDGDVDEADAAEFNDALVRATTPTPGDTDLDGDVDFADFLRFADNFGKVVDSVWADGDFDNDDDVDFADFLVLADNFGKSL